MKHCLNPPKPNAKDNRLTWSELPGASLSLSLAELGNSVERPIFLITQDIHEANRLHRELAFFLKETTLPILSLPDWETLPYDQFSPHEDILSERLATLSRLPTLKKGIVIAATATLMHQFLPTTYLAGQAFQLHTADKLSLIELTNTLIEAGYQRVEQVRQHGEYSLRGAIIDLFAMGSTQPYRIELFDDLIESIRTFDPETQLSIDAVDSIALLPAREYPLDEAHITQFRQRWRSHFPGNPRHCPIYDSISSGQSAAGIEYYLPLFYETLSTIGEYLPENTIVFETCQIASVAEKYWEEIEHRYEQLSHDQERPICEPNQLFLNPHALQTTLSPFLQIHYTNTPKKAAGTIDFMAKTLPDLTIESREKEPYRRLSQFLNTQAGRILLCAESTGRRETLLESLEPTSLNPTPCKSWSAFLEETDKLMITVAPLDQGAILETAGITFICESDLFGEQVMQRRLRKKAVTDPDKLFRDLNELKVGAPVVHIDHGIGRYLGLQTITTDGVTSEYLTLAYADKDKIYVPIAALHLISRYTGVDEGHIQLQKLGNAKWQKIKKKAAEKIRDTAAELLDIYSQRAATPGQAFPPPDETYQSFRAAFPFEETPDQTAAIHAVLRDMQRPQSMDRLICGDVGFGKTEVAMQAAFVAANHGKQVAILTPTTLLAEQHYHNFQDRFADWPIRIAALSRLQTKKNQTETLSGLKKGTVDIVIGTHRLLQPDIQFKDLGLLIVDEEHRFGVHQKEKIKQLRAQVDILTLTATPIPRTLNLAMTGTRDLSIIATPPAKRLAVKTFLFNYQDAIIREAITREIMRGGQVYFLHNDVASIEAIVDQLQKIVPEARIQFAHGQMRERQLEQVMSDFYHQRFNILVSTTIIESGIDVPSANTIIINKANHFGLAQLHQLRGRVGRSHHQAYAYLLVRDQKALTKDAKERLEAITQLDELGAGFSLATHDLEIRGAGEILGDEQSGHMQAIGFTLYMQLLEEAVSALKAGKTPTLSLTGDSTSAEVDLHRSALLPESYIPDVGTRLTLYKRLSNCKNSDALQQFKVELIDRFGLLPPATQALLEGTELRILAESLGIAKIDLAKTQATLTFQDKPQIDPQKMIRLIQNSPKQYQLKGANQLRFILPEETEKQCLCIKQLLDRLR